MSIQLVKRGQINKNKSVFIKIIAVIFALVSVGIYLAVIGYEPFKVYGSMLEGSVLSIYNMKETIIKAIPILICSLGLGIAFKMNFWNIGAEGQMLFGAFGAAFIALNLDLPKPLLLTLMIIVGMICAGLWALIPGYFQVQWKTNETITTLMMNYIALKFITFLQYGPWKDPKAMGFPKIATFSKEAKLPSIFNINIGWIIALVLVIAVNLFLNHSKKGFEASVIGESKETARYVGMNTKKTILMSVFISGAICGLAGAIQASAVSRTLSVEITQNSGNIAIIVAWLSNLKPGIMIIVSFLFAALLEGGEHIQIVYEIPAALANIIQATVLFFILGSEFFIKYQIRFKNRVARSSYSKEVK